jgi:anti-anti-sigma factor
MRPFDEHDDRVVVTPRGEIDLANHGGFGQSLLVAGERAHILVVDMARVTFFDLAAVHELSRVRTELLARQMQLEVRNAPPMLLRLLDALGLRDELGIGPDGAGVSSDRTAKRAERGHTRRPEAPRAGQDVTPPR